MSASLIGRLGSALSGCPTLQCRCLSRARASLRNRHQGPSIMGFEDEVEQSLPRPCHQTDDRSKRTHELTSSIVPRGTSFHRWAELEFPPVAFDPARSSCRCDVSGPAELGAVDPDAVHDHGQPSRQRHDRLLHSAMPGDLHRPGLEPRPFRRTHQHDLCGFVEHHPHHLVSASRYGAWAIALSGLVPGWRQSKYRPDRLGVLKASWHVDGGAIGQRHHRTDTGTVIRRRHTSSSRTIASKRRCRTLICSRSTRRTMSSGSTNTARSGRFSTSSLMRASNLTVPTMPTLRPKLRKVPRRSLSMAIAFDCKSLRWVSSIRSFWLRSDFTWTGR